MASGGTGSWPKADASSAAARESGRGGDGEVRGSAGVIGYGFPSVVSASARAARHASA